MDFALVAAYQPIDQIMPLARAAEEHGFRAMAIADHVVDLEELATPYPYTRDGHRRWEPGTHWPDPFVLIGALSQAAPRLEFFTSIYVAAMRNPFVVAKAVGTAAALSQGRVRLGVGVGWSSDEFELLGEDFTTRGRRTDEMLDLMKSLWEPGWTEFDGDFYRCDRLVMEPTPPAPVPIWVGGISDVALRRAARHDGWISDMATVDQAVDAAARLGQLRKELGREGTPFDLVVALTDAFAPEQFARARDGGVTLCMTMPWMYYFGADATLEQKLESFERFRADVMEPLSLLGG